MTRKLRRKFQRFVSAFALCTFAAAGSFSCASAREFVEATAPIVDPLLRVIGYCKEHAPKDRVDSLVEAYRSGDKMSAVLQAAAILQELRDAGVDVPRDQYSDLVMTLASIEGMQRGLRALDNRDADGNKLPVPPEPVPE